MLQETRGALPRPRRNSRRARIHFICEVDFDLQPIPFAKGADQVFRASRRSQLEEARDSVVQLADSNRHRAIRTNFVPSPRRKITLVSNAGIGHWPVHKDSIVPLGMTRQRIPNAAGLPGCLRNAGPRPGFALAALREDSRQCRYRARGTTRSSGF